MTSTGAGGPPKYAPLKESHARVEAEIDARKEGEARERRERSVRYMGVKGAAKEVGHSAMATPASQTSRPRRKHQCDPLGSAVSRGDQCGPCKA